MGDTFFNNSIRLVVAVMILIALLTLAGVLR